MIYRKGHGGRLNQSIQLVAIPTAIPTPHSGPINIAVGPDRNIWFTGRDQLGRVMPDGAITVFPLAPNTRPTGLSAGSDRRPPDLLTNRLWYAAAGSNKIGFLSFQ